MIELEIVEAEIRALLRGGLPVESVSDGDRRLATALRALLDEREELQEYKRKREDFYERAAADAPEGHHTLTGICIYEKWPDITVYRCGSCGSTGPAGSECKGHDLGPYGDPDGGVPRMPCRLCQDDEVPIRAERLEELEEDSTRAEVAERMAEDADRQRPGGPIAEPHPEARCHRCGGWNARWFAPSPLWNLVMRSEATEDEPGIICPACFNALAEAQGIEPFFFTVAQEDTG